MHNLWMSTEAWNNNYLYSNYYVQVKWEVYVKLRYWLTMFILTYTYNYITTNLSDGMGEEKMLNRAECCYTLLHLFIHRPLKYNLLHPLN